MRYNFRICGHRIMLGKKCANIYFNDTCCVLVNKWGFLSRRGTLYSRTNKNESHFSFHLFWLFILCYKIPNTQACSVHVKHSCNPQKVCMADHCLQNITFLTNTVGLSFQDALRWNKIILFGLPEGVNFSTIKTRFHAVFRE